MREKKKELVLKECALEKRMKTLQTISLTACFTNAERKTIQTEIGETLSELREIHSDMYSVDSMISELTMTMQMAKVDMALLN